MKFLANLGKAGLLIAIIAVLVVFGPQIAHFATDYLWFSEIGYAPVFLKFTFAKFAVLIPSVETKSSIFIILFTVNA